jgi:hypothetical protein
MVEYEPAPTLPSISAPFSSISLSIEDVDMQAASRHPTHAEMTASQAVLELNQIADNPLGGINLLLDDQGDHDDAKFDLDDEELANLEELLTAAPSMTEESFDPWPTKNVSLT